MILLNEYYFLFIYLFFILIFCLIVYLISFLFIIRKIEDEKNSSYECGFNPFNDARNRIDIKFYLVSILFIIFDLEVLFLFLWIYIVSKINIFDLSMFLIFLVLLFIGFLYELLSGSLDW